MTTSGQNIFIGENAGNFTMGSTAAHNYQASYNLGIGGSSLSSNTTGFYNVAVGHKALDNNTTGNMNTAVGYRALTNNTSGYNNTGIGNNALTDTVGSGNTAVGRLSLDSNTSGSNNVALGLAAGRYISDGSTPNQTGSYNLFLGVNTKANADGDTNEIVIGYNATGLGSNSVVLGNDNITTTALKGSVGIGTTSPSAKLDVRGSDTSGDYICVFYSGSDIAGWIKKK